MSTATSSWFSDFTGKAGALLEKMDQAAATSLQDAGIATPNKSGRDPAGLGQTSPETPHDSSVVASVPLYEPTAFHSSSERGAAVAQVLVGSASGSAHLTSTPRSQGPKTAATHSGATLTSQRKQLDTEDSIFEFLNAPSASGGKKTAAHRGTYTPTSSRPSSSKSGDEIESRSHQISPSLTTQPLVPSDITEREEARVVATSSVPADRKGEESDVMEETETEEIDAGPEPLDHAHARQTGVDSTSQHEQLTAAGGVATVVADQGSELEEWKRNVSNLQLENKLMKREVSALNEELSSVTLRANKVTDARVRYESEMHTLREQVLRSDHVIRQLRSHEEDLQATAVARDSQVEVLRTQLSVGDRALEEAREKLLSAKREQERLVQDAKLSSGAQSQALDSLKLQLSQTLAQLEREREDHRAEKLGFVDRESFLQSEQMQLSESCAALQRQVAAGQGRAGEIQGSLQSAQREVQALRKEHEEYKLRATGILQAKEKLISSLQQSEGPGGVAGDARLEDHRLEKEHLQAQLTNTMQQLGSVRGDMQVLEEKAGADVESVLEQARLCEAVLGEEKKQHAGTRNEVARLNQELDMAREDLIKERTKHREDVDVKDSEVASLNLRMVSLTPGRAELEGRLHELTETLVHKQTTLETLNSEKTTLHVQLQRLQGELADARRLTGSHTTVQVNGLESSSMATEGSRVPSMSSVIPSLEGAMVNSKLHKVRRAVNSVDRISIRLGAFLKRYPQARLFTLLYMLLLHVWVMVVMLTYSPEAHDANDPNFHTGM